MPTTRAVFLFAALGLAGCSVQQSHTATGAQQKLVGLTTSQLSACAGVPDHVERVGAAEYRTYAHDASASSGVNVTLPLIGGISFGGGGYCRATFELQNNRVTALHYAGDKDDILAPSANCAYLVKSCVRQVGEAQP